MTHCVGHVTIVHSHMTYGSSHVTLVHGHKKLTLEQEQHAGQTTLPDQLTNTLYLGPCELCRFSSAWFAGWLPGRFAVVPHRGTRMPVYVKSYADFTARDALPTAI